MNTTACPSANRLNYTIAQLDILLAYKHYINGWSESIIISCGIIANSLTIFTLSHNKMRQSSTNLYLLALTSSNLISLICMFLMYALRFTLVHPYREIYCHHWYEDFINRSIPYITPINITSQLFSIYLIIAVSIDRYVIVKSSIKNLKKRRFVTIVIIFIVFIVCFLFTSPSWFAYKSKFFSANIYPKIFILKMNFIGKLIEFKVLETTIKYHKSDTTEFGLKFHSIFDTYLYITFVFGLPIIILFIVNSLITYELVKIGNRKRKLHINNSNIDRNITLMLVAIVIVFLVCQVPLCVSHIIQANNRNLLLERNFFIFNAFTNLLACIYMSSNFVLFCFFGQKFRSTLKLIFSMKDKKYKKCEKTGKRLSSLKEGDFGNVSTFVNNNSSSNVTQNNSAQKFLMLKRHSLRSSSIKNESKYSDAPKQQWELQDLNKIDCVSRD